MTALPFRIGFGYDVHQFGSKRPLILGGVHIPHDRGLQAHSDGDCLCHAIADAMLGACGLQDVGAFFPDDDPELKGINSLEILGDVLKECRSAGFAIGNLDTTIVAEMPKIGPHAQAMKAVLGETLGIAPSVIGIKATTNEGMGSIGRGEGIAAFAVCLLVRNAS